MHDNPPDPQSRFFDLPDYRVAALEGRDAAGFAHAQFMNDVAGLADGHWQWNGWLTPKGRVIALFALVKFDAQTLWLVLPDVAPGELAAALQRFVFRSKVTLTVRANLHAAGCFLASTPAFGPRVAGDCAAGIELDFGTADAPRTLRLSSTAAAIEIDRSSEWAGSDLAHGLPRLPQSQAGQWTPQQLSLDRLRAYSIKKGCYPGQEIVARTHFLGQAKRGLGLFESDVAVPVGSAVLDGERSLGTTISAASWPGGHHSLAVLALERDVASLQVDGIALRERPLLEGLGR